METLTYTLSRWTTDELVGEVVRRSAADGPALRSVESVIIRARLAESDRKFRECANPQEASPAIERVGVRGTLEMGLADGGDEVELLSSVGHEVDAATSGAHAHDHTHRRVSSTKFAAHEHHHLHLEDVEADGQLNGHTHARAHSMHPWERADSA